METVGAYYAKTHLSQLLDQVDEGQTIVITRHGVPVAVLQPFKREKRIDVAAVIDDLHKFRKQNTLDGLTIKEMIEEGRR